MSNKDILALCVGNLLRRKTRTVLAVIGVIVGVCAIVIMVSIGVGLSETFQSELSGFGNLHTIEVYDWGTSTDENGRTINLDSSTIKKLGNIDGVTAITPVVETYLTIGIGSMKTSASVYGVEPEFINKMNYDLESGRVFSESESDANVLLFGYNIACWFYNPRMQESYDWSNTEPTVDVVTNNMILTADSTWGTSSYGESEIEYEEFKAEGVGLLAGADSEDAYKVYMPINALEKIIASNEKAEASYYGTSVSTSSKKTYSTAMIYVEDTDKVSDICTTIKEDYGFYTYSLQDIMKALQQIANMIELVLGGIGAVSLLVAAIGIANTMIMSVYERTREIGVMKVIGASLGDIQKMFLVEAGLIGFGGGVIGIGISYGMSSITNLILAETMAESLGASARLSIIPWWLAIGALLFASLVGIISGWAPARRAMSLSALEGLRNE